MNFYINIATDVGTQKTQNQDSLFAEQFITPQGNVVFAILCDGMGGLTHGDVASGIIVSAFSEWAYKRLPSITEEDLQDHVIRKQWTDLVVAQNKRIIENGRSNHCQLGSTVTAILLTQCRYYVLNIGDSRAYEIREDIRQLTIDHTVIAEQIRLGNLSEEQAKKSPIKNILTRCVGVEDHVYPDLFFGDTKCDAIYMLCSDGFRHYVTEDEMQKYLLPRSNEILSWMESADKTLVELNKHRGEMDNISVISIYTRMD